MVNFFQKKLLNISESIKFIIFVFLSLMLFGCSGGGGSSGINSGSAACSYNGSTYSGCYPARQSSSIYETSEYQYNYGVGDSNSSDAYSRELSGEGTVVGVFDTGINTSHTEFSGKNISGYNYQDSNSTIQDQDGHGTHVAGIISANKNDTGMHGIAYGVTSIQSYQILKDDGFFVDAGTNTVIQDASNRAISANVKVANHSWGGSIAVTSVNKSTIEASISTEVDGYESMVSNNIIQVWATGNDYATQPSVRSGLPYHYSNIKELWIAVMAIDTNGNEANFSNRCGVAADWCIAAPGVSILSADEDDNSGYTSLSGTSMAAPHVTGAIAVLIETFPTLSAEQIVDRLLTTASTDGLTDTDGNSYSSAVFGHGKLDLDSATKPIEVLSLSTAGNNFNNTQFHNVNNSKIKFSNVFGTRVIKNNKVKKQSNLFDSLSSMVAVFDSYDNATFYLSLSNFIEGDKYQDSNLEKLIFIDNSFQNRVFLTKNIYIDFVEDYNFKDIDLFDNYNNNYFNNFSINYIDSTFNFSYNYSYSNTFFNLTSEREFDYFYTNQSFQNPLIALNGISQSFNFSKEFSDIFSYNLFFETQIPYDYNKKNFKQNNSYLGLSKIEFKSHNSTFGIEYGLFYEPTSFLGSMSSGAFAIKDSKTNFLSVSYSNSINTYKFSANFFFANTNIDTDNGSMYSNFDNIRTSSWFLVIEKLINHHSDNFISLLIHQPLRANSGSFSLDIPKFADSSGNIYGEKIKYDLEPDSREINYEVSYNLVNGTLEYKLGGLLIKNGGHISKNSHKILLVEVKNNF